MQVLRLDSVSSTNDFAQQAIKESTQSVPLCVIAREQTEGRGTDGKTWYSPRDAGIYMSLVEPNDTDQLPLTNLFTLATGIACVEVLRELAGVDVQLKAINDLMCAQGKIGGILTEAHVANGNLQSLITGIGINTHRADRPIESTAAPAISLQELMDEQTFESLSTQELISAIVERVMDWHEVVAKGEVDSVKQRWTTYALPQEQLPETI